MKFKVETLKPRNPVVRYTRAKKSGKHLRTDRKNARMEARFNRDE